MYTQSLLTTALLAATSVAADQIDQALSKVGSDGQSLALQNTVAVNAVYSWQATQTAVSNADIQAQNDDYFNAFLTATATALPAYYTAVPTTLQPYLSSLLVGQASLVVTDVAPIVSSNAALASASGHVTGTGSVGASSANSISIPPIAGTIATSGMPSNSVNATGSKTSTNPGSPTTPPNPPQPKSSSGAGRNGVLVAVGLVGAGLAGVMSLL